MVVRVGTSGWSYPHWKGRFYPAGLAARDELPFAATRLDALEINTTFYGSAHPDTFRGWRSAVAALPDFHFSVKGSRYITHMKKLRDVRAALANFFAMGPLLLGDALGPILWQLPPTLAFDADVMSAFLGLLPRDAAAAQRLARRHDARFNGRASAALGPGLSPASELRYAVEPRHTSFVGDASRDLLERAGVAAVVADTAGRHVVLEPGRAPLAYFRLHGSRRLYGGSYDDRELHGWAARIRNAPAPEVWVFFDNDELGYAAEDAVRLRRLLAADTSDSLPAA
jgi:uncharacterized protein YecE (DUF72 family)